MDAGSSDHTWKDKTLDYEIETQDLVDGIRNNASTWKDKTLDYEIETRYRAAAGYTAMDLKR